MKPHIFIIAVLMMIVGCQKAPTGSVGMSDAELIQLIIDANKVDVPMDEMPSQSQTVIEEDYNDYMGMAAKKAAGLGYEVDLAGVGRRYGDRNEVYFNLEGRKLDPNDWGRKGGDWDKDGWDRDDDKEDWKCFDLVFPITFDMPDGSTITVTSDDEDGWAEIKAWYETNPDAEEKPALQYPVEIIYEDETITINDDDEMRAAYRLCGDRDDDKDRECFELVFPVTYIMPDGSTITVTSDDEDAWAVLRAWYEANPDAEEEPTLQYPVDILYADGTTQTINNDEEMRAAEEECR